MKSKYFYCFIMILSLRALGVALFPFLFKFSPIILIIISPFLHHLILTSTIVWAPLYFSLAILVSIFQCTIGYELGFEQGRAGYNWLKRNKIISEAKLNLIINWVKLSSIVVLFVVPGPITAMVVGVAQYPRKRFYLFMVISQLLWIFACLFLGIKLEFYLERIKLFIFSYWPVLSLVFISSTTFHFWWKYFYKSSKND